MPNDPGICTDPAPTTLEAVDRKSRTKKLIAHKDAPRWEGKKPPHPSEWTRQRTANMNDRKDWQRKRRQGKLVPRRECASGRELLEAKTLGRYAYPLIARLAGKRPQLPPAAKYQWREIHTQALAWIVFGQLVLERAAVIITHDQMAELLGVEANTGRYRGVRCLTSRSIGDAMRDLVDWQMLIRVQPTFRKFCKACTFIFPAEVQVCPRCSVRHVGRGVRLYRHANTYAVSAIAANAFSISIAAEPSFAEICTADFELPARRKRPQSTRKRLPGKPSTTLRVDSGVELPRQSGLGEVAPCGATQNLLSPDANESPAVDLRARDRASTPAAGFTKPVRLHGPVIADGIAASVSPTTKRIGDAIPAASKLLIRTDRERFDAREQEKRAQIRAYLEKRTLDQERCNDREAELVAGAGREAVRIENDRLRHERELRDRGRARERGERELPDLPPPAPRELSDELLEQARRDREAQRFEPSVPKPVDPERQREVDAHIERVKQSGYVPPKALPRADEPLSEVLFRTLENKYGKGKIGPVDLEIIAKQRRDEQGGGK